MLLGNQQNTQENKGLTAAGQARLEGLCPPVPGRALALQARDTDTDTDTDLKQKSERQYSAKQLAPSDSQVIGDKGKRWALR